MRLFIAIELSQAMRDALTELQNDLYDAGIRGHFSPEENFHLTLAFLGELPDQTPVLDVMQSLRFTAFQLELQGIGSFGDSFWAGITNSPPLEAVVRRLRRALAQADIPFDRKKFRPHITLLRKAMSAEGGTVLPPPVPVFPASMPVERIALYRSDRGKTHMIYTKIGEAEALSDEEL